MAGSEDMSCRFCAREGNGWPEICLNTRDVEDRAAEGDDSCYQVLVDRGGAEKGLAYVKANRRRSKT